METNPKHKKRTSNDPNLECSLPAAALLLCLHRKARGKTRPKECKHYASRAKRQRRISRVWNFAGVLHASRKAAVQSNDVFRSSTDKRQHERTVETERAGEVVLWTKGSTEC